jgi:hypothetical protein
MEALRPLGVGLCTAPRLLLLLPHPRKSHKLSPSSGAGGGCSSRSSRLSTTCSASKWADRLIADFQFLAEPSSDHSLSSSTTTLPPSPPPLAPPEDRHVSIPLDFYRVLGAESHFLADGIRRAYEARVSKPPPYGFSDDALISRRQILQAACETLTVKENISLSKIIKIIWVQPVQPTRPPDSGNRPGYLVTPEYARYLPKPRVHSDPMIYPGRGSHPSHRSSRAEGPSEPRIPPDSGS